MKRYLVIAVISSALLVACGTHTATQPSTGSSGQANPAPWDNSLPNSSVFMIMNTVYALGIGPSAINLSLSGPVCYAVAISSSQAPVVLPALRAELQEATGSSLPANNL